jgi:hypothetical protein
MKVFFICITTFLFANQILSQCPNTFAQLFYTQNSIDSFKIKFPNCNLIETVVISNSPTNQITNLNGLSEIDSIGSLTISNRRIKDLKGLENLVYVNNLFIFDCDSLITLEQIKDIKTIKSSFKIQNNKQLTGIKFDNVSGGISNFEILGNAKINEVSGFENVTKIDKVSITGNNSLIKINGFNELESTKELSIFNNINCKEINGFHKLSKLESNLILEGNILEKLSAFSNLRTINGNFYISNMPVLYNIQPFNSLDSIKGSLSIINNNKLSSLNSLFPKLSFVKTNLQILQNESLTYINDFNNINKLGGILEIQSNNVLKDLNAFKNLTTCIKLTIYNNRLLEAVNGFEELEECQMDLWLFENFNLLTIPKFLKLKNIGGSLRLGGGTNMKNLEIFNNLESIKISMSVDGGGLQTISGFSKLKNAWGITFSGTEIQTIPSFNSLDSVNSFFISGLPKLKEIKGFTNAKTINSFFIAYCGLTKIEGFNMVETIGIYIEENNNLEYVSGFENVKMLKIFDLTKNLSLLQIPKFNKVTTCGDLEITFNHKLTVIDGFQNLLEANSIRVYPNNNLVSISGFNNLKSVKFGLNITSNSITSLPNFDKLISAEIIGIYSTSIDSINGFNSLINSDLYIWANSKLGSVKGFKNLKNVSGSLEISNNIGLNIIDAFNELNYIGKNLTITQCPKLESVLHFEKLIKVGGNFSFEQNGSLKGLPHFVKLRDIGGNLSLLGCNFADLVALNSLNKVNGSMTIAGLPRLTSLVGLQNIDPYSISYIEISGNKNLSICHIHTICEYLKIKPNTLNIKSNAIGCNTKNEIDCDKNSISGNVFYDFNKNKIWDNDEVGIPNIVIASTNNPYKQLSSQNGSFSFLGVNSVEYTIKPELNDFWKFTTDKKEHTVKFTSGSSLNINNNFGLIPVQDKHDATISVSSEPTRCNRNIKVYIKNINTGTFKEEGKILFTLDKKSKYVESSPPPKEVNGNTYIWEYKNLNPYQSISIEILCKMPDETNTGKTLKFSAKTTYKQGSDFIQLVEEKYTPLVLCSYDPNDKLVMPSDEIINTLIDVKRELIYTIRFQNEGNAEAIDIKILDTIGAEFDLKTFKVINSSFPVQTSLNGNLIEFNFPNIWLPAKSVNEAASNGFVSYKINPKPGLPLKTKLKNTAAIYFDQNPPIITNTVCNIIDEIVNIEDVSVIPYKLSIFPNPFSNSLTLKSSQKQTILIYDLHGKIVDKIDLDFGHTIWNNHFIEKGVYIIKDYAGNFYKVVKI